MNDTIIGKCWHCGNELTASDYGRENNCLKCGKPTRVCRNCRWYAPSRPNQCEEPMAEEVMDKSKANFCSYFEATDKQSAEDKQTSADELHQAAEDLFNS